jgi:DNA-binding MarR family transcriptional regulator
MRKLFLPKFEKKYKNTRLAYYFYYLKPMKLKPEESVDFHIRWAWHNIARLYNAEATRFGGSVSQGYVLLSIDKEGTPSTYLGPKMGMEARSLTRTLKTMEDQGLIERKTDDKDGRMIRIHLTEKGRKKRETAKKAVLAFNSHVRSIIPENKLHIFFEVITSLNKAIENTDQVFISQENGL